MEAGPADELATKGAHGMTDRQRRRAFAVLAGASAGVYLVSLLFVPWFGRPVIETPLAALSIVGAVAVVVCAPLTLLGLGRHAGIARNGLIFLSSGAVVALVLIALDGGYPRITPATAAVAAAVLALAAAAAAVAPWRTMTKPAPADPSPTRASA
jgi:hypothetical protein